MHLIGQVSARLLNDVASVANRSLTRLFFVGDGSANRFRESLQRFSVRTCGYTCGRTRRTVQNDKNDYSGPLGRLASFMRCYAPEKTIPDNFIEGHVSYSSECDIHLREYRYILDCKYYIYIVYTYLHNIFCICVYTCMYVCVHKTHMIAHIRVYHNNIFCPILCPIERLVSGKLSSMNSWLQ